MSNPKNNGVGITYDTPSGRLTVLADLSFRAVIRDSVRSYEKVLETVEAVSGLSSPLFMRCGGFRHDSEGFHLAWPAILNSPEALPDLIATWRAYPAVHLSDVLDLGRFLFRASSELDHLRPLRFLFSPPQVCRISREFGPHQWIVVPLPIEGAGLADFVEASESCMVWLSGDEVLGIAAADRCYLLGAVLYHCLIADLLPDDLSRRERFHRRLSFRVGNRATARNVLRSAVPKALAPVGEQLVEFICALLSPSLGRVITPPQAVVQIERFQTEFAPTRIAQMWEAEGNNNLAVAILNSFAQTVEGNEVPWATLARLRQATGDIKGATEALARIPKSAEEVKTDFMSQTLAAGYAGRREDVVRAVARLTDTGVSAVDHETFLFLVYMNARFLKQFNEAAQLLSREFAISWHKVTAGVLAARIAAERGRWVEVSKNCRSTSQIIGKMPDNAGSRGRYALTFLNLIDAVAHIRVVENGYSTDYLSEACSRIEKALTASKESGFVDLRSASVYWLGILASSANAHPTLDALHQKIEALGRFAGTNLSRAAAPLPLPWFEEFQFFPTLSTRTE